MNNSFSEKVNRDAMSGEGNKKMVKPEGYEWSKMWQKNNPIYKSLPDLTQKENDNRKYSNEMSMQPTKEVVVPDKMITSVKLESPPKEEMKVGQLVEPKPTITLIKTPNDANNQTNVPIMTGTLTDVPLINSANPDNFYVLYSKLIYNVVT